MREQLVGRWQLQSWTALRALAAIVHPFGERMRGRLVYPPTGWMSVQIAAADRRDSSIDQQLDFPRSTGVSGLSELPRRRRHRGFLDLTPLGRRRYITEWPWHNPYRVSEGHAHRH
jgi:hypothetical protein